MQSRNGNCITEEVTEMPRCCSRRIQSEVAWRVALRPLTVPAIWMAPPNSSSFSVRVVLPASGWEMMATVRLLLLSLIVTSFKSISYRALVQPDEAWVGGGEYPGARGAVQVLRG